MTHHHYSLRILSSFLDTSSGGVPTAINQVVTDNDSNRSTNSTNPGSTASRAELAIFFFPVLGVADPSLLLNLSKVQGVVYDEFSYEEF